MSAVKDKATPLVEGSFYLCSDGWIRRLDKIEPQLLTYANEIDAKTGTFMRLSPTWRRPGSYHGCEDWFTKGEIIDYPAHRGGAVG
jgi:hypothetical protein